VKARVVVSSEAKKASDPPGADPSPIRKSVPRKSNKSPRRRITPSGLKPDADKQRRMLADYIKLTAWWLGRPPLPPLPRRLEQVLRRLLNGDSEKQIARSLNVSTHTVHDYAKELHKRLGVNTRGELLNRFLPRG
jgi:DNA-binding NarL/FixJ family response regulator